MGNVGPNRQEDHYVELVRAKLDRLNRPQWKVGSARDRFEARGFDREIVVGENAWFVDIKHELPSEPLSLNAVYDASSALLILPEEERRRARAVVVTDAFVPEFVKTVSASLGVELISATADEFEREITALIDR